MKGLRLFFMIRSMHRGCDVPFFLLFVRLVCLFNFRPDVLDIVYNGNFFGHATLKSVFNVLDETIHLSSLPYFRLYFRHAQLDHEDQGRVNKLAKMVF